MTQELIILAPERPGGSDYLWAIVDKADQRVLERGSGAVEALPLLDSEDCAVRLILDGRGVSLFHDTLPARSDAMARRSAPFVLEDQLASMPETVHAAVGPDGDGKRQIAVLDEDGLAAHLEYLLRVGYEPSSVHADYMALAALAGERPIAAEIGDRLVLGKNDANSLALDTELIGPVLGPLLRAETGAVDAYAFSPETTETLKSEDIKLLPVQEKDWADLMASVTFDDLLDLRQGQFQKRFDWRGLTRSWTRAIALAAAVLLLWVAGLYAEALVAFNRAEALDTRTLERMQSTFPGVRNISHMQSRLNDLKAGSTDTFLVLSALLYASVESTEGVSIQSLRFDRERAQLGVSLTATNFTSIETVRRAVNERGGRLEEGASRQSDGRVIADVTLTLGRGR